MIKIAFGIIVCNGDDYLEACIKQVYDFADQIVIAEGATKSWMSALGWDTPESKDRTNEILKKLENDDPASKLKVIHNGWENKIEQSNGYMSLVDTDIDYIWQLDSDEFYMKKDLILIKNYLEEHRPTYVDIKQLHFFKNLQTLAVGQMFGWGWETPQPRIQKYYPNCKYIEHRPPMIIDPITGLNNKDIKRVNITQEIGVVCYHYNYVTNKQVHEKITYYAHEFPQAFRLNTWLENVWKKWDIDKEYVETYYGTHPTAWQGSKTIPYNGPHPEEIERIKDEIILDNS